MEFEQLAALKLELNPTRKGPKGGFTPNVNGISRRTGYQARTQAAANVPSCSRARSHHASAKFPACFSAKSRTQGSALSNPALLSAPLKKSFSRESWPICSVGFRNPEWRDQRPVRLTIKIAIAVGPMSAQRIKRGAAHRHGALLAPLPDDRQGPDGSRTRARRLTRLL
ncbi:hypothetical protein [Caballeronia sp. HLA56]